MTQSILSFPGQGILIEVVIVNYFQIWNKKEHNAIISSRVISSILRHPILPDGLEVTFSSLDKHRHTGPGQKLWVIYK